MLSLSFQYTKRTVCIAIPISIPNKLSIVWGRRHMFEQSLSKVWVYSLTSLALTLKNMPAKNSDEKKDFK